MKFGYTIIYVSSVRDTLEFYEKAFGLATRFCTDDAEYAELEIGSGGTTLSFANETFAKSHFGSTGEPFRVNRKDDTQAAGAEISFIVDSEAGETVEATFKQAVAAGATALKAPGTKPWGQEVAYVRDLNGFIVEICTSVNQGAQ